MRVCIVVIVLAGLCCSICAADQLAEDAQAAMAKAARFMDENVATRGGYLWWYAADLSQRAGEGKATPDQVWVQAGTPMTGMCYLRAYETTGDDFYLNLASKAAQALIWGQLECGGWDYKIDFSEAGEQRWYYRHLLGAEGLDTAKLRNTGVFDDNNTQSAVRLLMAVDKAVGFEEPYHDAAMYGLDYMLKAQFDNGAWPQRFPLAAKGYSRYYTFNDNSINDCIAVMLMAWDIYQDDKYREGAGRGGDFIILSQQDQPQAGWAQQYDWNMEPAGARKFEPASLCPAVTSRNLRTLVDLYLALGDEQYLAPIPPAIQWLEACKISDDVWPRFVEIGTDRPLYFTKEYELVYTDDDLPTHYSFQSGYGVRSSIAYYEAVREAGRDDYLAERNKPLTAEQARQRMAASAQRVQDIIAALDEQGRWLRDDRIQTRTFRQNFDALRAYVALAAIAEAD